MIESQNNDFFMQYHYCTVFSLFFHHTNTSRRHVNDFIFADRLVRVITDANEMERIIDMCHSAPEAQEGIGNTLEAQALGGHIGISKTRQKVSERFYWRGFTKDVERRIASCDSCQRVRKIKKLNKNHEEMHPIYVESKVCCHLHFHTYQCDRSKQV